MDDIAIGTSNLLEGRRLHHQIVKEFLELLRHHSYFLKASKCEFEKTKMEFLGFSIQNETVQIDPSKIGEISDWPRTLHSQKQVRQILGILGYQRAFIKNYAHLARPLHNLLKKGRRFKWNNKCRQALDALIQQVFIDSILSASDESRPFELETCYVHMCQDCIRIGKFLFLIYDDMRPLIMTACLASFGVISCSGG